MIFHCDSLVFKGVISYNTPYKVRTEIFLFWKGDECRFGGDSLVHSRPYGLENEGLFTDRFL